MVVKHSEYQKQYGKTVHKLNTPSYEEKLAYRHQRRAQEYSHTPIAWENADELSDDSLTSDEKEIKKQAQEPSVDKLEAEGTGDEDGESDGDGKENAETDCHPAGKTDDDLAPGEGDVVVRIPASTAKVVGINLDSDKSKTYKIVKKKINCDKESKAGRLGVKNKTVVLKKASKKAKGAVEKEGSKMEVAMRSCPCPRRMPPPPPRPVSAPPDDNHDPGPFINYGWADKERETGRLRTFNTRTTAKGCVYESALRALRQRMIAWDKTLKQRQHSREKEVERSKSASHDPSPWVSSYTMDFHSYDDAIYKKNRMALRILPHVSHFKP